MKRDKQYKWIKKFGKEKNTIPYEISITPTNLQSYDRGNRCLIYIKILEAKITRTVRADHSVYLDYDAKNRLVGVEIT